MIKSIKVESKHGNVRTANAVKGNQEDEFDYLLEFIPNKSSVNYENNIIVGKTILRHQINSQILISYDFKLTRGLYDVMVTKVDSITESEIKLVEDSRQKYSEPVMVGGKYKISVKMIPTMCYGSQGLMIVLESNEVSLDSKTVYYNVLKEELENIRFYVPFNNSKTISFFVKGVTRDSIALKIGNPSFEFMYSD
ncbi:hypothetical protein [Thomasclavelia sp.]|uniref:hypothetical protein n=1 Tax=Thomasclavelia sp. TaxID=3025757 RepID=UPI0025E3AB5C|nr:hypothetical protein [Thomasclavelia sp.]